MNTRLALYFFATFLTSLGAGISDGLTAAGWVRLVVFSLAAACTAAVAYWDKTHANGAGPIDTSGSGVKTLTALAILATLTFTGCQGGPKLTPTQEATLTRIGDKVLSVGESFADRELDKIAPKPVVVAQ